MKLRVFFFLVGFLSLVIGVLLYVFGRPPDSNFFLSVVIPAAAEFPKVNIPCRGFLPSMIHPFSFSLLTVSLFPLEKRFIVLVGGFWVFVNLLLEFEQEYRGLDFYYGAFDFFDITAILLGGVSACFLTLMLVRKGGLS